MAAELPVPLPGMADPPVVFYVSPHGKDSFTGRLPQVNEAKSDGPLATLSAARDQVRKLREQGRLTGPVTVYLRGGRYELDKTVVFTPDDSAPVTYASYPGEQAVLDGGRRITGWRPLRVNDRDVWMVDLPEVKAGNWYFRELFVDGRRAARPRLPKAGVYNMTSIPPEYKLADGHAGFISTVFGVQSGLIRPDWKNFSDVDLMILHYWVGERSPMTSFDPASNLVHLARVPTKPLGESGHNHPGRYYLENIFEALTEPGEWYLDRPSGKLYYIPRPGEDPAKAEVIAPRLTQLLQLSGKAEENRYVSFLRFRDLTFSDSDWTQPFLPATNMNRPELNLTCYGQSESQLSGAIQLASARYCAIENCRLTHLGWYAVDIAEGCTGNRIVGNEMTDMGGGGVKINGSAATGPLALRTTNNRVTDNVISAGGRVFPAACGILCMNSAGNTLSHNDIHDLYYTGISCGWTWGYAESAAHDNRIEMNHIYNLGQHLLSDMSGIYTLGGQSGTVIRGNLIHDITTFIYGSSCIYPDEGSSHLLVENNVCYNTNHHIYDQHFGREIIVRNNIFAFGGEGEVDLGKDQDHNEFVLERNILVGNGRPIYRGGYASKLQGRMFQADLNLIWDYAGTPVMGKNYMADTQTFSVDQWHELGQDLHSLIADPLFKDVAHHDFTLQPGSPALPLGFHPIDLSTVGPRPAGSRD